MLFVWSAGGWRRWSALFEYPLTLGKTLHTGQTVRGRRARRIWLGQRRRRRRFGHSTTVLAVYHVTRGRLATGTNEKHAANAHHTKVVESRKMLPTRRNWVWIWEKTGALSVFLGGTTNTHYSPVEGRQTRDVRVHGANTISSLPTAMYTATALPVHTGWDFERRRRQYHTHGQPRRRDLRTGGAARARCPIVISVTISGTTSIWNCRRWTQKKLFSEVFFRYGVFRIM